MFCKKPKLTPVTYDLRLVVPILLKELRPSWKIIDSIDTWVLYLKPGIEDITLYIKRTHYYDGMVFNNIIPDKAYNLNDIIIIKQELEEIIIIIEKYISQQLFQITYINEYGQQKTTKTFDLETFIWMNGDRFDEIHIKKIDTIKL